jgi:predicted peptidase
LADFLNTLTPGTQVSLAIVGKDGQAKADVELKLDAMPGSAPGREDYVPARLPAKMTVKKALEPLEMAKPDGKAPKVKAAGKQAETGFFKRTNAAGDRRYWIYVHKKYDPQIAHSLVVWLHAPGKFSDEETDKTIAIWEDYCKENHIILAGPLTDQDGGWTPSDTDLVLEAVRDATSQYTIAKNRVVAHGVGNGGQMAFHLAFKARDVFRGAATLGSVLTEPEDNMAYPRLSFYVAGGERDPVIKAIAETRDRLVNKGYPVHYRVFAKRGREYLEDEVFAELVRWIETLDRL